MKLNLRALLNAHSNAAWTLAVLTNDQVHGKVHDGEQEIGSLSPTTESMQNGMTSMISCCCTAVSLATFAKLQTLTTESTQVDFPFGVRESGG